MVVNRVIQFAKRNKDKEALVTKSGIITYGQLYQRIIRCSEELTELVLDKNEPLGIALPNSAEFVILMLACELIGHPTVLLGKMLKLTELEYHVLNSGLRKVFSCKSMLNIFYDMNCELEKIIDNTIYCWNFSIKSEPKRFCEGDFICQLTSGTNGMAKGVVRTSKAVLCEIEETISAINLFEDDIILTIPPIYHSYGLIAGTLAPLCIGAKVILRDGFVPADVKNLIQTNNVTMMFAVPFMYHILSQSNDIETIDFTNVRYCFSAGATMLRELAELFYKKTGKYITQDYGSTETGVMCLNTYSPENYMTVGLPQGKREIVAFDKSGNTLPKGQTGEFKTKSLANARCYLYPDELNKIMYNEGWLKIGDYGKVDEEGRVYVLGINSSMINVAGLKVDPAEVEKIIMSIEGVKEVAAVGVDSQGCGQVVKVVIACKDSSIDENCIIKHCKKHLANYKIPRIIEFVDFIPRSQTGKILRKYLICT